MQADCVGRQWCSATSELPAEARNGAQNETEAAAVHDGCPITLTPATDESEKIQPLAGGEPNCKGAREMMKMGQR
jgi:hypothetical protein